MFGDRVYILEYICLYMINLRTLQCMGYCVEVGAKVELEECNALMAVVPLANDGVRRAAMHAILHFNIQRPPSLHPPHSPSP